MLEIFKTNKVSNKLDTLTVIEPHSWINLINPTEEEIDLVNRELQISKKIIKYALNGEEMARIENEDSYKLIIMNIPIVKKSSKQKHMVTIPFGVLMVRDEYIVTICLEKISMLGEIKNNYNFNTNSKINFIMTILNQVTLGYLKTLNIVNKDREIIEDSLYHSTKNKDLIKLLNIDKSLVYMEAALKSNEVVLDKIMRGKVLSLTHDDLELLEDTLIENKKALDTTHLYTEILSSTTEAFGTIISNNLNIVMKFLAGITIVFSVPTMISSFMGMNVPLGLFGRANFAFLLIVVISFLLSILIAYILKKKDLL